jgi:uncharacterized iron-regulated membrane protein
MSLINDAIKQANKANKDRATAAPAGETPPAARMQTTEGHTAAPASSGSMTGMLLIAGVVVFVLLGGTLLFLAMRNAPDGGPVNTSQIPSPAADATPSASAPVPVSDAPGTTVPPQPIGQTPPSQPANAASSTTTANAAVVGQTAPATTAPAPTIEVPAKPAGPRAFPELKLQGIYYRIKDPSVMINGKTLEIGDLIEDAKVIKIDRKEVTLELDSQQKVLRLQ